MNTSTPEPQDPWDKLHDADRDKPLVNFTKGEIIFWGCFFVAIIAGICIGAIKILSIWLELP